VYLGWFAKTPRRAPAQTNARLKAVIGHFHHLMACVAKFAKPGLYQDP
jgi:hypothetical protein